MWIWWDVWVLKVRSHLKHFFFQNCVQRNKPLHVALMWALLLHITWLIWEKRFITQGAWIIQEKRLIEKLSHFYAIQIYISFIWRWNVVNFQNNYCRQNKKKANSWPIITIAKTCIPILHAHWETRFHSFFKNTWTKKLCMTILHVHWETLFHSCFWKHVNKTNVPAHFACVLVTYHWPLLYIQIQCSNL